MKHAATNGIVSMACGFGAWCMDSILAASGLELAHNVEVVAKAVGACGLAAASVITAIAGGRALIRGWNRPNDPQLPTGRA